ADLDHLNAFGLLQVDGDRWPAPVVLGIPCRSRLVGHVVRAMDAYDIGTHVGELPGAERQRPETGQLDDREPGERAAARHRGVVTIARTASRAAPTARSCLAPRRPASACRSRARPRERWERRP